MPKHLKIFVLILVSIVLLGCNSTQQKKEIDTSNVDGMPLLSSLYIVPAMIEFYYQEHQYYPASKEDFLEFCHSRDEYQSFNNNLFNEIKYELLDDGYPQIGIAMQTEPNGTTQYLEIKLKEQKANFDELPPQTKELMQQKIQEALQSTFHDQ